MLQVAVFSDSQLRPLVEKGVKCPGNWYVNCTPGGRFSHVTTELLAANVPVEPRVVVLMAGTNDMARYATMTPVASTDFCATRDFETLVSLARTCFPQSEVGCEYSHLYIMKFYNAGLLISWNSERYVWERVFLMLK